MSFRSRIILLLKLVLITFSVQAQHADTQFWFGLSYGSGYYEGLEEQTVQLHLGAISHERLTLGVLVDYGSSEVLSSDGSLTMNLGVLARYAFNLGQSFRPFAGLGFKYGDFLKDVDVDNGRSVTRWTGQAGLEYFVNPWLALEMLLEYQLLRGKQIRVFNPYRSHGANIRIGTSFYLW